VKTYEVTFGRDPEGVQTHCSKIVVQVQSETAHGAEDYARIRFDLSIWWKVKEVKEVV
jgi:hypothetical protein